MSKLDHVLCAIKIICSVSAGIAEISWLTLLLLAFNKYYTTLGILGYVHMHHLKGFPTQKHFAGVKEPPLSWGSVVSHLFLLFSLLCLYSSRHAWSWSAIYKASLMSPHLTSSLMVRRTSGASWSWPVGIRPRPSPTQRWPRPTRRTIRIAKSWTPTVWILTPAAKLQTVLRSSRPHTALPPTLWALSWLALDLLAPPSLALHRPRRRPTPSPAASQTAGSAHTQSCTCRSKSGAAESLRVRKRQDSSAGKRLRTAGGEYTGVSSTGVARFTQRAPT